ncbi:MAG: hypothetical protein WC915_02140 [archaeon]|jgi:hypothetical protein
MQKTELKEKYAYSPTLNTVLMVENTMKSMPDSAFSLAKLKKELPKQVNHNMLKIIIDYLEDSNKIVFSSKGITWTQNQNKKLNKSIKEGFEI